MLMLLLLLLLPPFRFRFRFQFVTRSSIVSIVHHTASASAQVHRLAERTLVAVVGLEVASTRRRFGRRRCRRCRRHLPTATATPTTPCSPSAHREDGTVPAPLRPRRFAHPKAPQRKEDDHQRRRRDSPCQKGRLVIPWTRRVHRTVAPHPRVGAEASVLDEPIHAAPAMGARRRGARVGPRFA